MSRKRTGGVVKGGGSLIGSKGVEYIGPTVTGRFSAKVPEGFNPPRSQEPRVAIIAHVGSDKAAALASVVACDFSEIERRVMAQMGAAFGVPEKLLRHARQRPVDATMEQWRRLFDLMILRLIDKELAYLFAYAGFDAVQDRIDEEGCGAVFAAAKEWPDADD